MKRIIHLFLLALSMGIFSCERIDEPSESQKELHFILPEISPTLQTSGFPQPDRNPMSEEGVILGKKLFFDPKLSGNEKISCASCHNPSLAFTDGVMFSEAGISGNKLHRNSPAIFNLAWQTNGLFWDGGAHDLESLNFGPLTHPDEMGADMNNIVTYLENDPSYKAQFQLVFGEEMVESAQISRAISQFVRSLISQNSKYDRWKNGLEAFSDLEIKGYQLYKNHCSSCHAEGLFTDGDFHNNGLDLTYPNPPESEGLYLGRFRITSDSSDLGAYKTPTLRNISLTTPYMHDGRFASLDEVISHYEHGIQINKSLAPELISPLQFSTTDREAILAFLHTLTDSTLSQQFAQ